MKIPPFDRDSALRINESRKAFLQTFLSELIGREEIKTALDVGCGYGFFSRYLKDLGLKVIAFDGRLRNVAEARRRNPEVEFKVHDVEKPSVLSLGSHDLVFCFGLLYHLENPFRAIRNLYSLTKKYLLIETQIAPYRLLISVLYEESHAEDQSLNYVVLMPTESSFVKMLYKAGFSSVYHPYRLPDHDEFRGSLKHRRVRTILLASKVDRLEPIKEWGTVEFRLIPEPSLLALSLRNWDTGFGKLLRLLTKPQIFGLHLYDWLGKKIPSCLILRACNLMVKPRALRLWPGWVLGAGQSKIHISTLARLLLWRAFSFKCLTDTFTLKWHNGIKILACPKVESCRSLFVTGYYEPNEFCFLNNFLKPGMVFVDIGANLGLYALFASKLVNKEGIVLAIEPSEREFKRLKANIELNQSTNIRPLMQAISNSSEERELLIAEEEHSGHNTFGAFAYASVQDQGKQRVRPETLDEVVKKEGLSRVDVIKIDVEGHELFVFEGAKKTLSKFRPILLLEIADRALIHQDCSSSQVLDFLSQRGYRIYSFDKTTGLPLPAQKKDYFDSENIIAVHKTSEVQI